ncbi:MAG: hypothetical protein U5R49_15680 [Deltaproteobacteria bacterium]|nr:hypothetical protein [Deltaproteobacteria bacterium]
MSAFRLKSRQWIVDESDRIIMGEGRKEILETIERTGSINQTAKAMKMSYKGVWAESRPRRPISTKRSSMQTGKPARR